MRETLIYCCIPVFEVSPEETQTIEYTETPGQGIKNDALLTGEMVNAASTLYEYLRNTMADPATMMELERLCHKAEVPYVWYIRGQEDQRDAC